MASFRVIVVTFLSCMVLCTPSSSATTKPNELLNVPSSLFHRTITGAADALKEAGLAVSELRNGAADYDGSRSYRALSVCLQLFDLAAEDLRLSLFTIYHKQGGSENLSLDVLTWLTAALTKQSTCLEELNNAETVSETTKRVKKTEKLIRKLLPMVKIEKQNSRRRNVRGLTEFRGQKLDEPPKANATVAQDGSGDFKTINEALAAAPGGGNNRRRYVIHIKSGIYKEYVTVNFTQSDVVLVGDGMGRTIITGDRSNSTGWSTWHATLAVEGPRFMAQNLTIQNTAGPTAGQAPALRVGSDYSTFYRCEIKSHQDTLFAHDLRQFYRECRISGTVDFIFGNAAAIFQKCDIISRSREGPNVVTAQSRSDPNQLSGFVFQNCNVIGDREGQSAVTYLGRPWKRYSRTVVMESYLGKVVSPEGWFGWNPGYEENVFYAEYGNRGEGSEVGRRVKWKGFHVYDRADEVRQFAPDNFFGADEWLSYTSVPYDGDL